MSRLTTTILAVALAACGGGAGQTGGGDDPEGRRLYDAALRLHLDGDDLGYRRALIDLAHDRPDSRYGRQATRHLNDGNFLSLWTMWTGAALPMMLMRMDAKRPASAAPMLAQPDSSTPM